MKTASTGRCKSRPFRELAALVIAGALAAAAFPARAATVVDATGARVALPERPARIVTLAPSLAELVADFLGDDLSPIVGVSDFTDYPPALRKVRSVGPYHRFSLEAVAALKPDAVFATLDGNPKDHVLHLRELGVPVVVVPAGDFDGVEKSIRLVGEALGRAKTGGELAARFRAGLDRIRARAAARAAKGRAVFLQVGSDPIVTVGKGAFLHHALEAVGARNVFGDLAGLYPRPALEAVISRDPETILVLALGTENEAEFARMAAEWKRFSRLKAVKGGAVRVLRADALLRPSMRLLEGLAQLERAVFPEENPG